jgi:hypothetical protein
MGNGAVGGGAEGFELKGLVFQKLLSLPLAGEFALMN